MQRPFAKWRHLFPAALGIPYVLAFGVGAVNAEETAKPFAFHDVNVLGTSMDLHVTTAGDKDAEKVHTIVLAEIERLRKILSTYDASTDISKVNASKEAVRVGPELIDVLKQYDAWQTKTKGAYSAGLGEAVKLWQQAEKDGKAPEAGKLAAIATALQKPLWKIDELAHTVQRLSDQTINVDSLGKGFIAEHAANVGRAQVSSVRGLLVNIGGDITALGSSTLAGFTPWTVAVTDPAHPEDNAPALLEIKISAVSVATSGNYARGYTVGDKKYSHILDPRTAMPVDFVAASGATVASATVVASDNAAANALASSLCVLSPTEGLALAKAAGAECLLVLSDGTQKRSAGFKRYEKSDAVADAGTPTAPVAPVAPTPKPVAADGGKAGGGGFVKDYQVSIPLELKRAKNHTYCAVWVETEKGEYVKTVTIWGNELKYLRSMDLWWKQVQGNKAVLATATRATRTAGKYPLAWDGNDENGKAVPAGKYKIMVETAVWTDYPPAKSSAMITIGADKSTATVAGSKHFEDIAVTYGPKGK